MNPSNDHPYLVVSSDESRYTSPISTISDLSNIEDLDERYIPAGLLNINDSPNPDPNPTPNKNATSRVWSFPSFLETLPEIPPTREGGHDHMVPFTFDAAQIYTGFDPFGQPARSRGFRYCLLHRATPTPRIVSSMARAFRRMRRRLVELSWEVEMWEKRSYSGDVGLFLGE